MVDLVQLGVAIGVIGAMTIATVIRSYRGGAIGSALEKIRGDKRDKKLDEIHKTVSETKEDVEHVDEKVDDLGEAIVELHKEDEGIDHNQLRDKVGVDELSSDIHRDT